jgi:hypothetical protein
MTTPSRDPGRSFIARLLDFRPGDAVIFRVVCGSRQVIRFALSAPVSPTMAAAKGIRR